VGAGAQQMQPRLSASSPGLGDISMEPFPYSRVESPSDLYQRWVSPSDFPSGHSEGRVSATSLGWIGEKVGSGLSCVPQQRLSLGKGASLLCWVVAAVRAEELRLGSIGHGLTRQRTDRRTVKARAV